MKIKNPPTEKFYKSLKEAIEKATTCPQETCPQKPPLGITPESYYEIERISELISALQRYSDFYGYHENMIKWTEELFYRLNRLKENGYDF